MTSEMFDPKKLLSEMKFPDDTTLDVCAGFLIHHELVGEILDAAKQQYAAKLAKSKTQLVVTVRHYKAAGEDKKDLCPDTMTVGEWKQFPGHHVVISISNGGVKSKTPEAVL